MESLKLLEQNIHQLLLQYQELYDRMQRLQEENIRQRDEILQSHAELQQLKQDHARLQAAHALITNDSAYEDEREKAKQRMTSIISQIDKALETLKQ